MAALGNDVRRRQQQKGEGQKRRRQKVPLKPRPAACRYAYAPQINARCVPAAEDCSSHGRAPSVRLCHGSRATSQRVAMPRRSALPEPAAQRKQAACGVLDVFLRLQGS